MKNRREDCPICFGPLEHHISREKDDWFGRKEKGYISTIIYSRCEKCKFRFQNPNVNEKEINEIYKESYVNNQQVWFDRWKKNRELTVNYYSRYVKNSKDFKILEVGCSNGFNLINIKEKFPKVSVKGFEFDKKTTEFARNLGLDVSNKNLDEVNEKFDLVLISHVLEHVKEFENFIIQLYKLLKENGKLVILVPNSEVWGEVPHWHHDNYFSKQSFETLFKRMKYKYEIFEGVVHEQIEPYPELRAIIHRNKDSEIIDFDEKINYAQLRWVVRNNQRSHIDKSLSKDEVKIMIKKYKENKVGRTIPELLLWSRLYRFFSLKWLQEKLLTKK